MASNKEQIEYEKNNSSKGVKRNQERGNSERVSEDKIRELIKEQEK